MAARIESYEKIMKSLHNPILYFFPWLNCLPTKSNIEFKKELENFEFKSEFELLFKALNLFNNNLFNNKSDKSIKNQEILRKIISKLAFLISKKKYKNINSLYYILNSLF